jgi:hypothetical protein
MVRALTNKMEWITSDELDSILANVEVYRGVERSVTELILPTC